MRAPVRRSAACAAAAIIVSLVVAVPVDAGPAADACDRIAAPGGSNAAPGTRARPVRGVRRLVGSLAAGETGCLRAGRYRPAKGRLTISTRGITLKSYPGERATLLGRLTLSREATGARILRLRLIGRNPERKPSPTVNASDTVFRKNSVTNRHQGTSCFILGHKRYGRADRTVIERNRIHSCGSLPPTNHDHGIYVAYATGSVIRGNRIYSNADRGVQLYPDADRTVVARNVIDANGQGVIFGGSSSSASDHNLIQRNIITYSRVRHNIESSWQGRVGTGNVARENCLWIKSKRYLGAPTRSGIRSPRTGYEAFDHTVARPRFRDRRSGDYRLRPSSRCGKVLRGR